MKSDTAKAVLRALKKSEKRKSEKRVDKSERKCYNIKVAAKAATDHRRDEKEKLQKRG